MDLLKYIPRSAGFFRIFSVAIFVSESFAQFSPGDLSGFHEHLEGMNNCLRCHETGSEISGKKCASCHTEIQKVIASGHGFHFRNSSKRCIDCHKEHLGRTAMTVQFDRKTFDHSLTGFRQTGKHATLDCSACHAVKNITDPQVVSLVNEKRRATFLGLGATCLSCHPDKHEKTVGTECQTCHTTEKWSSVARAFDHSKTSFSLVGKHANVECRKCHLTIDQKLQGKPLLFLTREYGDCTPCHSSPHSAVFTRSRNCSACHTTDDWRSSARSGNKFNHDLTAFKLIGKHASVACEKCHKGSRTGSKSFRRVYSRCSDCHADYHQGDLAPKYGDRCESCHTLFGFSPATFTVAMHNQGRFALTGAHGATVCIRCHTGGKEGRKVFRFANTKCEACHKDKHDGQFVREMISESCGACHSTTDWQPENFDHSKTAFPLVGKHASVYCQKCHKPKMVNGIETVRYKGTTVKCQGCHEDAHGAQFMARGETNCVSCHKPDGWLALVFDHSRQSTFMLDGAHARAHCRSCHREERRGAKSIIRYKPLSTKCESCHAKNSIGNG